MHARTLGKSLACVSKPADDGHHHQCDPRRHYFCIAIRFCHINGIGLIFASMVVYVAVYVATRVALVLELVMISLSMFTGRELPTPSRGPERENPFSPTRTKRADG
jgi:hypothetical protein